MLAIGCYLAHNFLQETKVTFLVREVIQASIKHFGTCRGGVALLYFQYFMIQVSSQKPSAWFEHVGLSV